MSADDTAIRNRRDLRECQSRGDDTNVFRPGCCPAIAHGRYGLECMTMRSLSSTADGKAPRIEFRVAAELHERVIKTAGSERGALSEFVRQAVTDAIERAEQEGRAPPDLHGLAQHGTTSDPDPARGLDLFSLGGPHGSQDPESDQPGAARRPADTPIINPPRRLTRKAEA